MAQRKLKLTAIKQKLAEIQALIAESDTAFEAAQDDNADLLDREDNDRARAQDDEDEIPALKPQGMDSARKRNPLHRLSENGGRGESRETHGLQMTPGAFTGR